MPPRWGTDIFNFTAELNGLTEQMSEEENPGNTLQFSSEIESWGGVGAHLLCVQFYSEIEWRSPGQNLPFLGVHSSVFQFYFWIECSGRLGIWAVSEP